jgi:hypothetical protein
MEWVAAAEEFVGDFGWGERGKNLGLSRMFGDGDKVSLSRNKMVAALRPRGILSGFLAVLPNHRGIVYLPPIAAKVQPMRLRLRVSKDLSEKGAIFSAYMMRGTTSKQLVLEDILAWKGEPVWNTKTFQYRWNRLMSDFVTKEFVEDSHIQGFDVQLASYCSLASLHDLNDKQVLELVPDAPSQKRLIWMMPREGTGSPVPAPVPAPTHAFSTPPVAPPVITTLHNVAPIVNVVKIALPSVVTATAATAVAATTKTAGSFVAKKEAGMGPDVYAIWRGEERLGLGLVRTLAVSRALRLAVSEGKTEIGVRAELNKSFEKYEILGLE